MMHELRTFTNEEFGNVRAVMINGNPYFCGKDVATALGYAKPTDAVKRHCNKVVKHIAPTRGGNREMLFIPGCDVLRLVTRSKSPSAEKFEDWVMDEVLPQMRETGGYIPVREDDDDNVIMARGLLIAQKTIEEKDKQLKKEREEKKMLEKANKELLQHTKIQDQMIEELLRKINNNKQ